MATLHEILPVCLISWFSDILWPACSPDLSASNSFLWGYTKSRRLVGSPQNIAEFKVRIRQEIQNIMPQLLSTVKI
jgi:hypothetical protein